MLFHVAFLGEKLAFGNFLHRQKITRKGIRSQCYDWNKSKNSTLVNQWHQLLASTMLVKWLTTADFQLPSNSKMMLPALMSVPASQNKGKVIHLQFSSYRVCDPYDWVLCIVCLCGHGQILDKYKSRFKHQLLLNWLFPAKIMCKNLHRLYFLILQFKGATYKDLF